jgi:hypothetical protein
MVRVKQLKDLELWYDALAPLTVTILTDMTGNTAQGPLTTSTVLTFPLTSGRLTYTLGLDGIYCTQIDIKIASTGRVILFGGVLRVLDVPVYFYGQNGEIWDSLPMNIGM